VLTSTNEFANRGKLTGKLANSFWQRDALLYSISSSAAHGLPRTNADKQRAVRLLLADAEWGQWSDRAIARHCQVSQWFVSRLRKGASDTECQMGPRKVKRGNKLIEQVATY
jgi:hypothetical protein